MINITAQEAFDTALNHLREQGVKSSDDGVSCQYRTPEGLKCAVGAMIPDDIYRLEIEGLAASNLGLFPREIGALLDQLQEAHDVNMPSAYNETLNDWENDMWEIADEFSLTYTPPTKDQEASSND